MGTVSSEYEPHQQGKDSTDVTFGVFILRLGPPAVCSTKTSELRHLVFFSPICMWSCGDDIIMVVCKRQHRNKYFAKKCCTDICGPWRTDPTHFAFSTKTWTSCHLSR